MKLIVRTRKLKKVKQIVANLAVGFHKLLVGWISLNGAPSLDNYVAIGLFNRATECWYFDLQTSN
jgi:hypothetical protein